jgi:hypothetical protein
VVNEFTANATLTWGGLKPLAISTSVLAGRRYGIYKWKDRNETALEVGVLGGVSPYGQPNSLGGTAHLGGKYIGAYVQYQAFLDRHEYAGSAGSLIIAGAHNIEGTSGTHILYGNAIVAESSSGTIGGRDVAHPVGSGSLLAGYTWNILKGIHNIGAEGILTRSSEGIFTWGSTLRGGVSSLRYGGDLSYVIGSGPTAVGLAVGILKETNRGGVTAFINIGIGFDEPRLTEKKAGGLR